MFYRILASIGGLIALGLIMYLVAKLVMFVSGVSIKKSDVCPLEKQIKKIRCGKLFCPRLEQSVEIKSDRCTEKCGFA